MADNKETSGNEIEKESHSYSKPMTQRQKKKQTQLLEKVNIILC